MSKASHDDRAHALLPPSASSRWLACPPSMAYVRALIEARIIKKRVSGEAAQRGTRIHTWGEQFVRWLFAGKRISSARGDERELAEAADYARYCVAKYEEAVYLYGSAEWGVEDRAIVDERYCWGSRDFWIRAGSRVIVIDLKSGREPVGVEGNTQFVIYADDLVRRFDARTVELCAWQPNSDEGGEPERSHVYERRDFDRLMGSVREGIERSAAYFGVPYKRMEPALKAGPHCGWCDALGVCPEARRYNQEISKGSFMPVVPAKASKGKVVAVRRSDPPAPGDMTPEQVGEILARAPLFSSWLEAVRTHALELMQRGKTVPGFKAVAKNTRYAWESRLTPQKIATRLGLKRSDIVEERVLSPSKVIPKIGDAKKKKLVESMRWRPFEVTIARESDRRLAIPSTRISFQPVSISEEDDDG